MGMKLYNMTELVSEEGLSDKEIAQAIEGSINKTALKKVLLIPPDSTRAHSGAGRITNLYYHMLKDTCEVDILIATGTHVAMTEAECSRIFGDIPYSRFISHNWRTDVQKVGEAPKEFVEEISEGLYSEPVVYEINKRLLDPSYDLILSIGQVVPHEVVGMANYTKNLLVGCGGSAIINASHIIGAVYGMERMMGKDFSPVRRLFDYAEENYLAELPLCYVLTVTTTQEDKIRIHGLFIGRDRKQFERAVALSVKKNIIFTEPLKRVVVYLDPKEFKSTWVGNKSVYRTRMAIADGGELIVIAPGVERFGEDPEIDKLVRKYGYIGRENIIRLCKTNKDLKENLSAAAHLIHGSSDGRFRIIYCPGHLTEEEVKGVGYSYMPIDDALRKYDPKKLKDGYNNLDGEKIYYISNPALGLWADRARF